MHMKCLWNVGKCLWMLMKCLWNGCKMLAYRTLFARPVIKWAENRQNAQKAYKTWCFTTSLGTWWNPYKTWWFWRYRQITLVRNAGPSQNPECRTEPLAQTVEKHDPAWVSWIFHHHSGMRRLFGSALGCRRSPWNMCKMLWGFPWK